MVQNGTKWIKMVQKWHKHVMSFRESVGMRGFFSHQRAPKFREIALSHCLCVVRLLVLLDILFLTKNYISQQFSHYI
jgi:hypothetical protein